ncbi:DNA phosphorothioation-associated putative methyltransferase [Streptomyces sp. CBMA156]|uniref:DNA phosphorothioation-associated putative methyltransferase n=1 Tax=Streptomyces sp. CBMA156 TaxID=1930280 RepID=UPI001661AD62|nr:DNA phosphorothioation-associated putative methyltransferase [Streptomyces sp. CBMA156]MBD0676977.1 ribosomal methyltransferase [Streptomyces sp. CBMA156]
MNQEWASARGRTAIGRVALSVPARQALADGQLRPDRTVLDYGCGRGNDVRVLKRLDCQVEGWDPYHRPHTHPVSSNVVLLTYVLNVIENPEERRRTLQRAWELASTLLVVSARLTWEKSKVHGEEFGDGLLTSRQTFQHLYTTAELRRYVEEVTGARVVATAPGVVYVFKDDTARLSYLAYRVVPDAEWLTSEDTSSALESLVAYVEQRGRHPRIEEMPRNVAELLAHLRPTELRRLVRQGADPDRIAAGGKRSALNTLLYLAVELFNGRGPFGSLPVHIQQDIRTFFASYKEACRRADRLLLKLRDDQYVRGAMQASVAGKMTPTALYVHRRALERIPTVLRLYEHCASIAAGRPEEWTVAKLRHQGRAVSWLDYPKFDQDPHPRITASYGVDLQTLESTHVSYLQAASRPLLHRKHEFLASDDPEVPRYRRLTEAEVRAGLYRHPHLIGTEKGWEEELARCGRQLRGHRLIRRKDDT